MVHHRREFHEPTLRSILATFLSLPSWSFVVHWRSEKRTILKYMKLHRSVTQSVCSLWNLNVVLIQNLSKGPFRCFYTERVLKTFEPLRHSSNIFLVEDSHSTSSSWSLIVETIRFDVKKKPGCFAPPSKHVSRIVLTRAIMNTSSQTLLPALRHHSGRVLEEQELDRGEERIVRRMPRRETRQREKKRKEESTKEAVAEEGVDERDFVSFLLPSSSFSFSF